MSKSLVMESFIECQRSVIPFYGALVDGTYAIVLRAPLEIFMPIVYTFSQFRHIFQPILLIPSFL